MLAEKMAQHFWTAQRAMRLQYGSFGAEEHQDKLLALYLRYQTTHDRAFHKCLSDLLKVHSERKVLKAEKKAEIGFESQKRQQELHEARVRLLNAKAENKEMDTEICGVVEAPCPATSASPTTP